MIFSARPAQQARSFPLKSVASGLCRSFCTALIVFGFCLPAHAQQQLPGNLNPANAQKLPVRIPSRMFRDPTVAKLIPYDEAVSKLQQRAALSKPIDVKSFLPPEEKSSLPAVSPGSRDKTIAALEQRLAAAKPASAVSLPASMSTPSESGKTIADMQKGISTSAVSVSSYYPVSKPAPLGLPVSDVKNGLTGKLLSYDQTKKFLQSKTPASMLVRPPVTGPPSATQNKGAK